VELAPDQLGEQPPDDVTDDLIALLAGQPLGRGVDVEEAPVAIEEHHALVHDLEQVEQAHVVRTVEVMTG
jgi:hypothetical protein